MTNSFVDDSQVVIVDVDEGVLEGSVIYGTHLIGFFMEN